MTSKIETETVARPAAAPGGERVLRTPEVAARLGLTLPGLRSWMLNGIGPAAFYPGGKRGRAFWREVDVDAWIKAQSEARGR